jgi:hypothetical protein
VRPVLVVVPRVHAQHSFEMSASENENAIEAVAADGAHAALSERVAFGACSGVRITSIPSERKISSKARLNFVSRSRISSWKRRSCSPSCMTRLRACWVTQAPSGLAVQAMHSSRRLASERKKST